MNFWKKDKIIADEIGTELTKPRAVTISRFRSNCGVDTTDAGNAETYYQEMYITLSLIIA